MADEKIHNAMKSVLEDMGRAAREGRARRFNKRPAKGVDVKVGEVSLEPNGASMDKEPDSTAGGISADEERDLMQGLELQQ